MTELTQDGPRPGTPEHAAQVPSPRDALPRQTAHDPGALRPAPLSLALDGTRTHGVRPDDEGHALAGFDRLRRHGVRMVRRMMNEGDDEVAPVDDGYLGPGDDLPAAPDAGTPAYLLAYDPAVKKYRQSEYETAVRIIRERQVRLRRADDGARHDWVDDQGTTYDAVGNFPAKFFDKQWPTLQQQIVLHVSKAQVVPVDVAQFTEDQRALVRQFVDGLANPQVVIVGDV